MFFHRITTPGLSHHSYFVSDGTDAFVVDPRRDVDVYLELAREQGANIRFVFETHRQEDFVIGSVELAERTGAEVLHGRALSFEYGRAVEDGEELPVGTLRIRALETPGHTAESMTYALFDTAASADHPVIAFTGDALFVGEVGRTDLYGPDHRERLADLLHDSIFRRILPLGDGVLLAPAHGGGSVCGAGILSRNESSLGFERLHNPRLLYDLRQFIAHKLEERMVVPPYFKLMEAYNLQGPPAVGGLPLPRALTPDELNAEIETGATLVDVRMPQAFASAHISGSYSVWLEGLAVYAGWVLPLEQPVVFLGETGTSVDIVTRMLWRVGFDRVAGYLHGGFETWQNAGQPIERTPAVSAVEARNLLSQDALVLDVRNVDEWSAGVLPNSELVTTAELEGRLGEVPRDRPVVVTCSAGHRGSVGASILQRNGYENVYNLLGGIKAWQAQGFEMEPGPSPADISRISTSADHPAVGREAAEALARINAE